MALLFACSVTRAEKNQWYSGAFEENKSGKKTTSSNVVGKEGEASKYVFGFASAKSNMAFAQYPLTPKSGMNAMSLEVMSKKGTVNAEIWVESKSWKFQGKIIISEGRFTKIILPLKECNPDAVKWMRLAIPNKNNPKRGMLLLKKPVLCKTEVIKKRVWHTGVFNSKEKSSCAKSILPDASVKFSWKFDGDQSGPVYLSTKFKSNEDCKKIELKVKNPTSEAVVLEVWIESNSGWKFQGKLKITSKEWKTVQYKLLEAKSSETKYFRIIAAPKGNQREGAVFIKNLKYIK